MFDTHTNLMWYPDHLSNEFVEFALEAKRAKMRLSEDVYFAGDDTPEKNAFDSTPEQVVAGQMKIKTSSTAPTSRACPTK